MKEFCVPTAKTYAFFMYDDSEKKKAKETKKMYNKTRAYVCRLYRFIIKK